MHQIIYLNLEGEGSSSKNNRFKDQFKFKLEMGMAGSVFEQPCNF